MERSQRHIELKISYLRHILDHMPHGKFAVCRDRKLVYITFDPDDPSITPKTKQRFFIDSPQGRIYAPLIERYLQLKAELDDLTALWNSLYWIEPRSVEYPLTKTRRTFMNSTYFETLSSNVNSYKIENPNIYKGMPVRSKNELIACETLEKMGFDVKVEPEIKISQFTAFDPDILFNIPEADKCVAIELDGAMDQETYYTKAENRKLNYYKNGFKEYKDVIFLRFYDASYFDISTFEAMIRTSVESNIDDIIFPSSTQRMNKAQGQNRLQNRVSFR